MVKVVDLHWAAGFLEGDGTFKRNRQSVISAAQVQKAPLLKLRRVLGGAVTGPYHYGQKKWNPFWKWSLGGPSAIGAMFTIYSLMSPKRRRQIREAVASWKARPGRGRYAR